MKRSSLLILFTFIFLTHYSQYQVEAGARQGALGGSGLVLTDIWSSFHNQGGLADIKGLTGGLFYSSIFNEPDLRETGIALLFPAEKYGNAGLNYTYSGNSHSNFSKFGFAYSKRLGKQITAGIQLDYFRQIQMNYGNTFAIAGEIGLISEPVEHLYLAAHVFNPWHSRLNTTDEYLSSIFRLGVGYYFGKKVILMLETEKELLEKALVRAGFEYEIMKGLNLRAGVASNPVKYTFGLGYQFKGISIDAAYISHQILGYYMQFGMGYSMSGKQEKIRNSDRE
jgi:hypothetical protein